MLMLCSREISLLFRTSGLACLVVFLCICVVIQMLGLPVTFLSLLNEDMLLKSDPISEDFSGLSTTPHPQSPGFLSLITEHQFKLTLPVLVTVVFHPPSA